MVKLGESPILAKSMVLAALLLLTAPPTVPALPSATITTPIPGAVLYERSVNVSGNASGSDLWWNHTTVQDFNGTCAGTAVTGDKGGEVALTGRFDDFNDNSIDTGVWSTSTANGMNVQETGSELKISGTGTSQYWVATGALSTIATGMAEVSADMNVASAGGGGHCAVIKFYRDANNYFQYGIMYDSHAGIYSQKWYWARGQSGSTAMGTYNDTGTGWHNLKLSYDVAASKVYMSVDKVPLGSQTLSLSDWTLEMRAFVRGTWDTIDARFDNVAAGTGGAGNYTSPAMDSRMASPELRRVNWTATEPAQTGARVFVRSSGSGDMSAPTGWSQLTNGQSDFKTVQARRYLQYRVELRTSSPPAAPLFESISLRLYKSVAKVEVSPTLGNWRLADGTANWSARMDLLDGERTIYCKVTDAAGDTAITSINVRVDTVKAVGALKINDGAEWTTGSQVQLGFSYSGPYQVTSMQLSNGPDFAQSPWENYSDRRLWDLPGEDGVKSVYSRLRDRFGLVSDSFCATIRLDTIPPAGSIEILGSSPVVTDPAVTLFLNAKDDSGVEAMQVSNNPQLDGLEWVPFVPRIDWTLLSGGGPRSVYARFRDAAGLVSEMASDSVLLAAEGGSAPQAALSINDGTGFCRDRNVTVNISITKGSAAWMLVGNDSLLSGAAWRPFEPSLRWTLPARDGKKAVYARFVTQSGNLFSGMVETVLDTVPPVGTLRIGDGEADCPTPAVRLNLTGSDANGIAAMRVSNEPLVDDTGWEPFSAQKYWNLTPGDGMKKVYVRLRDPAGWVSAEISTSIFLRSRPAPTGYVSINKGKVFARSTSVNLTLWLDDLTLAEGASMKLSNLETFLGAAWEPFSPSKNWKLATGDGLKTVFVMYESGGVVSPPAMGSIVLDTVAPLGPVFDSFPERTTNNALRLSGTVEPGTLLAFNSEQVTVRSDGRFMAILPLSLGQNTIQVRVADEAGNTAITDLAVTRVPKEPVRAPGLEIGWLALLSGVAFGFAFIGLIQFARRRKAARSSAEVLAEPGTGTIAPFPPVEPAARPSQAPEPVGAPPTRLVLRHSVAIEDLDDEEAGQPEPLRPEPPAPKMAPQQDGGRFSQTQLLRALTSLPKGLPSTLWGYEVDELAAVLAKGQYRETPEGELLVKVGAHWYHGDPSEVGKYMQRYR
jgi:hypothetical protein